MGSGEPQIHLSNNPKNEEEILLELTAWFPRSVYGHLNSSAVCGDLRRVRFYRYGQCEGFSYAQVKKRKKKYKYHVYSRDKNTGNAVASRQTVEIDKLF